MNFSEALLDKLKGQGYTHCFFVAGGNIMHLLNAARSRFQCIPVVHEVTAVIAAEYFNESANNQKAFALVTAGPGLTNGITGIAGAWLESRFVLIIGGQVKSGDLSHGQVRQRGIQELDGVSLVQEITKLSRRVDSVVDVSQLVADIELGQNDRPGPVFIEVCIDVQAAPYNLSESQINSVVNDPSSSYSVYLGGLEIAVSTFIKGNRPIILIGGGISRQNRGRLTRLLEGLGIPSMTTWNGADRLPSSSSIYYGRPNTWGQRYSNVILQQCDVLVAIGTRLGLQQSGFNWENFVPKAEVIHVDIDNRELNKGHPRSHLKIQANADEWLLGFLTQLEARNYSINDEWIKHLDLTKELLPLSETCNSNFEEFVNPYEFIQELSDSVSQDEIVIPCSSGGAFTVFMQAFEQKGSQTIISNKGLASMGYGLAGSLGACLANQRKRVILIEGDGGFAQNMQDLGTVSLGELPIKIVIFDNGGYASIRMTQLNYFNGAYIGCDTSSGLGLPKWPEIFKAFDIPVSVLKSTDWEDALRQFIDGNGPAALLVPIHPKQTYFPKISSRVQASGSMESNPLHLMTPELDSGIAKKVFKYL